MLRLLPKVWATLACLSCALFFSVAAAEEIKLEPIKVSPHVYYFRGQSGMASAENKGFMSNAGFVVTKDGVVVFDALATPALGDAMVKAIRGVTLQPIKRVIISHYHADHFYGLQSLKAQGAEIWAHENAQEYLRSDLAKERLEQRRSALAPWVNQETKLVPADRWLSFKDGRIMPFEMGGMHFRVIDASGAHSPEDIMMFVEEDGLLFAGDLFFTGRIPFVGDANSKSWLGTLDRMLEIKPRVVVPGHGEASNKPLQDIQLTKGYLIFLRQKMGEAVNELLPFEEAYNKVDWTPYANYPAFQQANRLNAYGTYILMERESLQKQ